MKKKILGVALAVTFLMGSSMIVCAEEAAPEQAAVQNYQPIMTQEILDSYQSLTADKLMESSDEKVVDEVMNIFRNAIVRRTDVWGELQDADGDGIDDRDPINGCGYIDMNYNGFDDRFEMAVSNAMAQEDPAEGLVMQLVFNVFTHRCNHGIIASSFEYDNDLGSYWSVPDYFDKCPECTDAMDDMINYLVEVVDQLNI